MNVDSGVLFADVSTNRVGVNQASPDVSLDLGANTDAVHVPVGTTGERPGSAAAGYFRYNSSLAQFEGYTDAWGAIGGGGTNTFTHDVFTCNGSTTAFALSQSTESEDNLIVFIDGVFQEQGAYSIATSSGTTTLTLSAAPVNGRKLVVYSVAAGVSGSNLNIDTMTGDGSDTTLTLSINPVNENNSQVFIDGVYQNKSTYAISGTTLTFSAAPPNGSAVEVMTMTQTEVNVPVDGTITSAKLSGALTTPSTLAVTGTITATTADNTDTLSLISTDADASVGPNLNMFRNSASPADSDELGNIAFNGRNDNSQTVKYAEIEAYALDVSDGTEDSVLNFNVIQAGAAVSFFKGNNTEVVVNDDSKDLDFRVESDGNTHALFVEGSTGNVGIGTSSINTFSGYTTLEINNATNGAIFDLSQGDTMRGRLVATTSALAVETSGSIPIVFQPAGTERMRISSAGEVTMPSQPAFLAKPASVQSNIAANNTEVTVAFGSEIFDQGGNFANNTFTAPLTGRYQLNLQLYITTLDSASDYYVGAIRTSNRIYYFVLDPNFSGDLSYWTFPVTALADMDAGDTAHVFIQQQGGTAQTDITVTTFFSGFLAA